jgi:formylglycine-generating enzyme required for sulfatase activity
MPWRALIAVSLIASCGASAYGRQGCGKLTCPEGALLIPPGTFVMGSDQAFSISEHAPAHQVTLTKAYCIDRTEVTQGAMAECVRRTKCKYSSDTISEWAQLHPRRPVDFVNWKEADAYCRAQGGRLPTDAEWEYAARGVDGRTYPWGNDPPTDEHWVVRPRGAGSATVKDVGTHPKGRSPFGLEDMSGNVAEWVADDCHRFQPDAAIDPKGPGNSEEDCRIKRGTAWSALNAG